MSKNFHKIIQENGDVEYRLPDGLILDEKQVCQYCLENCETQDKEPAYAEERLSFGIYAGKYCDDYWRKSGYRDATDSDAVFDPMDAGESLEEI